MHTNYLWDAAGAYFKMIVKKKKKKTKTSKASVFEHIVKELPNDKFIIII